MSVIFTLLLVLSASANLKAETFDVIVLDQEVSAFVAGLETGYEASEGIIPTNGLSRTFDGAESSEKGNLVVAEVQAVRIHRQIGAHREAQLSVTVKAQHELRGASGGYKVLKMPHAAWHPA